MPRLPFITLYIVQHHEWYQDEDVCFSLAEPEFSILTSDGADGLSPMKTFLNRTKAELHCRTLEEKEREGRNPFRHVEEYGEILDFDPTRFRSQLRAMKIQPPGRNDFTGWWDRVATNLDGDQRNAVWDAVNPVCFFTVIDAKVEWQGSPAAAKATKDRRRPQETPLSLVERIYWRVHPWRSTTKVPAALASASRPNPFKPGDFFVPVGWKTFGEGDVPVKVFLAAADADVFCREQEQLERQKHNPFRHGEKLAEWTTLDAGRLHDWMLDAGLTPPAVRAKPAVWRNWYDRVQPALTDVQFLNVWEALDKVRFFRVVELTQ